MKRVISIIEEHGLTITHSNNRNLWVKSADTIIMLDLYELFGLEVDDLMLHIKQKFYRYNIKIDIHNPDNNKRHNNKPKKSKDRVAYIPIDNRKKKIRELLTNKYKLLP